MTHEEILQLLYDETLIGNAPAVKDGVNEGLEQGLEPERMLYDALIPSLEEVGARFRAWRLLRPRDADRRPRDAGRARHPAAAAG